jgi:hypothetical protein
MGDDYRSVKYLDDVDDNWVKDFIKQNIPVVYNGFTQKLKDSLVGEFIKLKEDAKFCGGDKVWLEQKLAFFNEKLDNVQGKEVNKKKEVIGLGMVMLTKLSEMEWRKTPASNEYLKCNESDLEKEVEALDSLFQYTKSEQDLLNSSGGRRKKSTKRRRKRTRKRRKSRRRKRRRKNLKKRTKRRR